MCDRSPSSRNTFIVARLRPSTSPPPRVTCTLRLLRTGAGSFAVTAMPIETQLTSTLGLRVPLVMGGMQWVGTPRLAAAVSNAGALGMITSLTLPTPEALKEGIALARSLIDPEIAKERSKYGAFGVNITLLPAIVPPDYEGYARAALEAGVRIFETAGSNPGPVIKILKDAGAYVIHKCTSVRHGLTALRLGADMLSIDGCTSRYSHRRMRGSPR